MKSDILAIKAIVFVCCFFFFLSQYGAVRFFIFFLCMHMCVCVFFGAKKEQCVRLGAGVGVRGLADCHRRWFTKKRKGRKALQSEE